MRIDTANLKVRPVPTLEKSYKTEKGEKKTDGTGKKNFDTYEPAVVMRDGVVLRSNLKGEYPKKEVKDPSNLPLNLVSSHTADLQRDITAVFEKYYTGKADKTTVQNTLTNAVEILRQKYVGEGYAEEDVMPQIIRDVYASARLEAVGMAYEASWMEGKSLAEKYGGGDVERGWMYYNADYYYRSEEMKDVLIGHMDSLAEKYNVSDLKLERDYPPDDPRATLSQSYNSYISEKAGRCGSHFGNMLNKDIVPPKGFQFFYISSGGANMYPGMHKGIFSEEEVFEMLRNIPEGYPPAPMKSMDEINDGILDIRCGDWSFQGRVPVRSNGNPVSLNMFDVVRKSTMAYPKDAVSFMRNWDFFTSAQSGVYFSSH